MGCAKSFFYEFSLIFIDAHIVFSLLAIWDQIRRDRTSEKWGGLVAANKERYVIGNKEFQEMNDIIIRIIWHENVTTPSDLTTGGESLTVYRVNHRFFFELPYLAANAKSHKYLHTQGCIMKVKKFVAFWMGIKGVWFSNKAFTTALTFEAKRGLEIAYFTMKAFTVRIRW